MDKYIPYIEFGSFLLASALSMAIGVITRSRGWLDEDGSKPVHLVTLAVFWAPISFMMFATQEIDLTLLALMLINPLVMLTVFGLTVPLGKLMKWSRKTSGVMILCCALSNQGFTLGAFACHALLGHQHEGVMQLGVAYVMSMMFFMVPIFYPIAASYGECEGEKVGKLMFNAFVSLRAMPMYAAVVGCAVSLIFEPQKALLSAIDEIYVWDAMLYLGAIFAYFGIGMRLRLGDTFTHWRLHLSLAGVKFVAMPAITMGFFFLIAYLLSTTTGNSFQPIHRQVMWIEGFSATAINAVIACNLFGLDARLASSLWLVNTLLYALVAFPIFAATVGLFG